MKDISSIGHKTNNKRIPQFLTGASFTNLVSLFRLYRVERKFWWRTVELIGCSLLLAPFYVLESLYVKIVPRPPMHPAPVFVIGHWRSGTTYLHYLLSKDKQFATCTNVDAFTPGALLVGRWLLRKMITFRLPKTRPMDNVKLGPTTPQEDEFAMMLLARESFYHGFAFPKAMKELFFNYVIFDPQNVATIHQWNKSYYEYLLRLSNRYNNKRLLLKNPVNTARVKYIVSLFPNAKFVYIHRSGTEVKLSTARMLKAMIDANCLQSFDETQLESHVELFHHMLIREYENQRHYVDENNLVEISYNELVARPLETVNKIYDRLHLDGFENSREAFTEFIAEQRDYKPHNYEASSLKH